MREILQQIIISIVTWITLLVIFYVFTSDSKKVEDIEEKLKIMDERLEIQENSYQEIKNINQWLIDFQVENRQSVEENLNEDSEEFLDGLIKYEDMTEEDRIIFDEFSKK